MTRLHTFFGIALAAWAGCAAATNGYFPHGHGTRAKGMAGASTAIPLDAMTIATNPANLVGIGDRVDVGLALFNPERRTVVSGNPSGEPNTFPLEPGRHESGSPLFAIPNVAWSRKADAATAWGVALYGHGGMNTDYEAHANPVRNAGGQCPSGTYCAGAAGVDLAQLFIVPSFARAFRGDWAWGVAPILAYQRFEAKGVGSFRDFSSNPQALSDNGYDESWGYGIRLGVAGALNDELQVGFSWQSRVQMQAFDRYAGLFAEGGGFDIPPSMNAGLAWIAGSRTVVALDVQHTLYSDVASIANPLLPNLQTAQLGQTGGAGFGWNDVTAVSLGVERTLSTRWVARLGYSYGNQPINGEDVLFNVLAPGVMTQHVTGGLTWRLDSRHELSLAVMYAPKENVTGTNPLDPNQTVVLEMDQRDLEIGYSYRF